MKEMKGDKEGGYGMDDLRRGCIQRLILDALAGRNGVRLSFWEKSKGTGFDHVIMTMELFQQ
jgi:hypothetical protein